MVVVVVVVVVVMESEGKVGVSDFLGRPTSWQTVYSFYTSIPRSILLPQLQDPGYPVYRYSTQFHYAVCNAIILNWPDQLVALPTRTGSGEKELSCSMESTE